jgi:hypothetical protein
MAAPPSVEAFQFIFDGKKMKALLDTDPLKVVCTVSIVEEVTASGKKVGALKIIANGTYPGEAMTLTEEIIVDGCPKPPCDPT